MTDATTPQDSAAMSPASTGSVGWIPVTERLPEKGRRVIFFVDRKQTGLMAAYVGEYVSHSAFRSWACYEDERGWSADFVTHWMSLPEPPA